MKAAINQIIEETAHEFNVLPNTMYGPTRAEAIAIPRMVAMELIWKYCGWTYQNIADYFGKRDHGTVLHARKRVYFMRENNKAFAAAYQNIESKINL